MELWNAPVWGLVITGVTAGVLSGLFGIGGGVVIVPILVLALKLPQHAAHGTSLVALLLPVGILGVMSYYKSGKITNENIQMGLWISLGLFVGALLGSQIAIRLSTEVLKKIFAGFLVLVAMKLVFSK